MKQFKHCIRIAISISMLIGLHLKGSSQNNEISKTNVLDSLIAKKEFIKAEAVLVKNIKQLKQKEHFQELTSYIYYVGKISLNLDGKDTAVKKTKDFANSITEATDSLTVSRQKHLILSRFYAHLRDYRSASEENMLALEDTNKMTDATGDLFGIIHHNLSIDFRRLGEIKKATWHSKKSLEYYLSYPKTDKIKILDAYNSLGGRMWDIYKIDSALYYFKKGDKIIDDLEKTPMNTYYHKAKTQSNISSIYSLLGQPTEALNYNEKAIKNYMNFIRADSKGNDFYKEEARLFLFMTIENYADDFTKQGNYKKAKDLIEYVYEQKLKFLPANDTEIAYTSLQLGHIYLQLKDYKIAEDLFDKGLEIYTNNEQKNDLGIADAYFYKGKVNDFYKNINLAREYYEKSKRYYEKVFGDDYDEFYLNAMLTYSNFYSKNGYTDKAIEIAKQTYTYVVNNQGETTTLEYSQLVNLANIYYDSKNYSEASIQIHKALDLIENSNSSQSNKLNALNVSLKKPMALLLKSKVELQLQTKKDSIFLKEQYLNLKEAISILEQQKTIVTEDQNVSIIVEDNNQLFEFSKKITLMLYKETKNPKYLNDILSLHESKLYNKIRQQLNIKSNFSSTNIPNEVIEQEKQLKEALNSALKIENGLESFFKANTDWTHFLETIKINYPKYYALRYASISKSISDFNSDFPKNTSVIRYVFIDDLLYAFNIEKDKIKVHDIDVVALNKILIAKENETGLIENNLNSNHHLYQILWQPFADEITNENLIIVPDGELFNLSFEVLTPTKTKTFKDLAQHSLLNTYNISYNYSLLLINKNKTPKFFENNFIAFSPEFNDQMKSNYKTAITDSVFLDKTYLTLLPQPFSKDLAQSSSKIFNGTSFINETASKQVFSKEAKEHKIIHIGTHAESNNVSPELSRLIFAKTINDTISSEDNSLYTYEIYNQNLASNLAILTACETGKPTYQAGEGMISLAHAFNYAGSESILTSLWKIDEKSSAEITAHFYGYLKNGLAKDEALRKAKLDYLATAQGRTLAPQYWAGLVLIGDTNPIELDSSSNLIFWLSISAVFLILLVVIIRKKRKA
ncbi:CHAT domain-containing tetratricopeptide repeat protein [Psychroserpens sp. AS72]|uniref:CHAT domain-containing protein n=1 Tax=Psychroserpens sp. AS72 TaxID=3135775 RepID=UPI00317867F5